MPRKWETVCVNYHASNFGESAFPLFHVRGILWYGIVVYFCTGYGALDGRREGGGGGEVDESACECREGAAEDVAWADGSQSYGGWQ